MTWQESGRYIQAIGPTTATIAVVGEAPGREEDEKGQPFCGEAGRLLSRLLNRAGLNRADIYIDNVVPYRPKGNKIDLVPKDELAAFEEMLRLRLYALPNLQLIVPLGNVALKAVTGKIGITKWRGSLLYTPDGGYKVLPSLHPAYLLRQPELTRRVLVDFEKIADEAVSPLPVRLPKKRNFIVYPSEPEIRQFEARLEWEAELMAIDIETNPTSGDLLCVGFSYKEDEAICIPYTTGFNRQAIRRICEHSCPKVLHNGLYDTFWLRWLGIQVTNWEIDTLFLHAAIEPTEEHSLAHVASLYTDEPYWKDEAKDPKEGTQVKVYKPSEALYRYNCRDVAVTRELADVLRARAGGLGLYGTYRALIHPLFAPLMDMMLAGLRVDENKRAAKFEELSYQLSELVGEVGAKAGVNLFGKMSLSVKKLQDYLYNQLGLPKVYKKELTAKGEKSLATDEATILKLTNKFPDKLGEVGPLLLKHRRLSQLSKFYQEQRVDPDGYFRFTLKPDTEAGRLSSKKSPLATGCVLPTAEVLTRRGWVAISQLATGEEVMQWDQATGKLSFSVPTILHYQYEGDLIQADSWFHRATYTPNHRIPYHHPASKDEMHVASAKTVSQLGAVRLPVAGIYAGSENFPLIRLLVATQADGSIESNCIRFAFKKQRKITRFLWLMRELNVPFTEQKAPEGYRRFCIGVEAAKPVLTLLGANKQFGPWLLNFSEETLCAFIHELQYWDGSVRSNSTVYSTIHSNNAEWVATIAHLVNCRASIGCSENRRPDSYGEHSARPLFKVNISPRNNIASCRKHYNTIAYRGFVWCLTVDTSYFLLRDKGRILITGNSNAQNIDREARGIYLPDNGQIFMEFDLSQVESRIVYMLSGDSKLQGEANLKPWEGDQHKENAALLFDIPIDQVTKEQRQIGKITSHGAQRAMTGSKLQEVLLKGGYNYTPERCNQLVARYYETHPGILAYFQKIRWRVINDRKLTTSWGRVLGWPYERLDDSLFRKAYSFLPQAESADFLFQRGLIPTYEWLKDMQMKSRLALSVHDSLLFSVDPAEAWDLLMFVTTRLSLPLVMPDCPPLFIPVELAIGASWAKSVEFKRLPEREEFEAAVKGVLDGGF